MELPELATAIQREYTSFLTTARTSLDHARRTGELLIEAKQHVRHGDWRHWLHDHTPLDPRVASNFMRIAREWDTITANRNGDSFLTITDALHILASAKDDGDDDGDDDGEEDEDGDDDAPPHLRVFQVRLSDAQLSRLRDQLKVLGEVYDTANDSKTVVACVQDAYERHQQEARDEDDSAPAELTPATN